MPTETGYIDRGVDRFIGYDNPLIAFEFLVIVVLCMYIFWKESTAARERKQTVETNQELAKSLAVLTEVVRNGKS